MAPYSSEVIPILTPVLAVLWMDFYYQYVEMCLRKVPCAKHNYFKISAHMKTWIRPKQCFNLSMDLPHKDHRYFFSSVCVQLCPRIYYCIKNSIILTKGINSFHKCTSSMWMLYDSDILACFVPFRCIRVSNDTGISLFSR